MSLWGWFNDDVDDARDLSCACLRLFFGFFFFFGCCCGVNVSVSDGCTEEKGKEGGVGLKYPWVNVIVLWHCVPGGQSVKGIVSTQSY